MTLALERVMERTLDLKHCPGRGTRSSNAPTEPLYLWSLIGPSWIHALSRTQKCLRLELALSPCTFRDTSPLCNTLQSSPGPKGQDSTSQPAPPRSPVGLGAREQAALFCPLGPQPSRTARASSALCPSDPAPWPSVTAAVPAGRRSSYARPCLIQRWRQKEEERAFFFSQPLTTKMNFQIRFGVI